MNAMTQLDLKVSMHGDQVTVTVENGYADGTFAVTGAIIKTRHRYTEAFVNMPEGYGHLSGWYPLNVLSKVSAS